MKAARAGAAILAIAAGAGLEGCGPELPSCSDTSREPCADDLECERVVTADSDAALQSAAAGASSGTCIALAKGRYDAVTLPAGVSVLGAASDIVDIEGLTVEGAAGAAEAIVRRVSVWNGIEVKGEARLRIDSVVLHAASPGRAGLKLPPGSSARVAGSEISSFSHVAVEALNAELTIERSTVSNSAAGGIWFEGSGCDSSCNCAKSPLLTISSSLIIDNSVFGLHVRSALAVLEGVEVRGTLPGNGAWAGLYGGGIVLTACADLQAVKVNADDNSRWGVLVDGSTARLGGDAPEDTFDAVGNMEGGIWINGACSKSPTGGPPCVAVRHGLIMDNGGLGVGVSGGSRGVVVSDSTIAGTLSSKVPIGTSLVSVAAHGVVWRDDSEVTLDKVTFSHNELLSVLIDGPASGSLTSLTLEDGDEAHPPLQQQISMGGAQPAHDAGVALQTDAMIKWSVPIPPSAPTQLDPP